MPFYDYECTNHHVFELKQPFTAEPVAPCPTCYLPAKRLISLVPVHFKGSGFYVNDYGRKQEASTSKTDGEGKDDKDNKAVDATAKSGSAAKSDDGGKADAAKKEAVKTAISQDKGSSSSSSSSGGSSPSTPTAK